ncbi:MAG: selenide, water dikinase SelD, partial [Thermoleophilia bacterium]
VSPPMTDAPADYGAIAALNALGDLHAMGATPLLALAVCAFPGDEPDALAAVLAGGAAAALAEGCPVLGGHTVQAAEPLYGLAAIGTAHPDRLTTTDAGRPGDLLVLTKPLGTGVVVTARGAGLAAPAAVAACREAMLRSNGPAARAAAAAGVRAATDVTGDGLIGHLAGLAAASGVSARLDAAAVPVLPGARDLATAVAPSGGLRRNRAAAAKEGIDVPDALLHDPQTNGGLLLAVRPDRAPVLLDSLRRGGDPAAAVVGSLGDGPAGSVTVEQNGL